MNIVESFKFYNMFLFSYNNLPTTGSSKKSLRWQDSYSHMLFELVINPWLLLVEKYPPLCTVISIQDTHLFKILWT